MENWKNFMTDYMDLALKYGGFTSLDGSIWKSLVEPFGQSKLNSLRHHQRD